MKRYFKHTSTSGVVTIATISLEAESVTITRKEEGSRTKGKPIRVPVKHCRDGSVELEARLRANVLLDEGFVFDREESTGTQFAMVGSQFYWSLQKQEGQQLMKLIAEVGVPPDVTMRRTASELVLTDADGREQKIHGYQETHAMVPPDSAILAVAYVGIYNGLGVLAKDREGVTASAIMPHSIYDESLSMSPELRAYLDEAGVAAPGVVKSTSAATAAILI